MAVFLRTGTYGEYYGNEQTSSNALTQTQMETNVKYIYNSLIASGWSINSICGMLGNMQSESSINPGRWQNNDVGNTSLGYGLVQWTPATKYINWVGNGDYSTMDNNLARINYEIENNIQWISTSTYNLSFQEFKTSTESPEYLANAFLYNYERPATLLQPLRATQARAWFDYLGGISPTPTPTPSASSSKKKYPWVLYANKLRNKYVK